MNQLAQLKLSETEIQIHHFVAKYSVNRRQVLLILKEVLKLLKLRQVGLTVELISNQKMIALNRATFNLNSSTDVISFPWRDFKKNPVKSEYLGDIALCLDRIKKQSAEYELSFSEELVYCLIHGVLHLNGYEDHTEPKKREMFRLQDDVFKKIQKKKMINPQLIKVKGN